MNIKQALITLASTLGAIAIVTTITFATSTLVPSETPGEETHYTLNDIYNKILDISAEPEVKTAPDFDNIADSFSSLTDIYDLLIDAEDVLIPENIKDGVEVFGVEGTLPGPAPELEWSTAQASDLCWDTNQGCTEGSGLLNGEGAVEYCANLDENSNTDWRLPTIEEYQSITDFTTYNNATQVSGFAQFTSYWSSTPGAENPDLAWNWDSYTGSFNNDSMFYNYSVRCVR